MPAPDETAPPAPRVDGNGGLVETGNPEQGPDFYDENIARMSIPLAESPWLALYTAVADLLTPDPELAIADLGCGVGRFAELLAERGYRRYWGVDFSAQRVELARANVPGATFTVGDLRAPEIRDRYDAYETFTVMEVLEHLQEDRDVVRSIPAGRRVILTVPNYQAAAHVRYFTTVEAACERYGDLVELDTDRVATVPTRRNPSRWVVVLPGRRRSGEADPR